MSTANRILEILYDRPGRGVYADELIALAHTKPSYLRRALEELGQRGHVILDTPTGLCLLRPTVLDAHLVERGLDVRRIGRHVICFGQVGSTNDVALAALAGRQGTVRPGGEAIVVTAEHQRQGRGRLGRAWVSPAGSSILASAGLVDVEGKLASEALAVAAALAVAEGIEKASGVHTDLEWPNDVTVGGKKLAGVLVELRRRQGRRCVVIGLGINVTACPPEKEVKRATTCLAQCLHAGEVPERVDLLRAVLVELDGWVERVAAGDLANLHELWLARCGMLHRRLTFEHAGRRITARVLDLRPLEGLLVIDDHGRQMHLPAASTSVIR